MRFIALTTPASTDQIYRVTVKPVINELDSADKAVALKILLGYEALVIVRPANARPPRLAKNLKPIASMPAIVGRLHYHTVQRPCISERLMG